MQKAKEDTEITQVRLVSNENIIFMILNVLHLEEIFGC